ncbi:MAG TPA: hypothetical protein V6D19_06380 [Stenomitos sp.]
MTKSLAWKVLGWQWLLACVATKLLEIFLDGIAGWLGSTTGTVGHIGVVFTLIVFRLISGALGGVAQWFVLRLWLPSMRGWVLATSIGNAIAFFINNRLISATLIPSPAGVMGSFAPSVSVLPLFVFGGISGLIFGVAQWIVLRNKLPQAFLWIPLSSIAMLGEAIGIGALQSVMGPQGIEVSASALNPIYWVIAMIGAAIYATLTGGFLVHFLRQKN